MGTSSIKEVWISNRADKLPGLGTKADPLNGNGETNFENNMNAQATYTWIHLVGTGFVMDTRIVLKEGWRVTGDGMHLTKIQWTGTSVPSRNVMFESGDETDNVVMENLTIDGNSGIIAGDHSISKMNALRFAGSNSTAYRVRATNFFGGADVSHEAFVLAALSGGENVATGSNPQGNNWFIECEVSNFTGQSGTMIMLGASAWNYDASHQQKSGIINCYVHDCPTAIGIGGGGLDDCLWANNLIVGCRYGFNRDTAKSSRNRIINNRFLNCNQYGISWRDFDTASGTDSFTEISGNTVQIVETGFNSNVICYWIGGSYTTNMIFRNNTAIFNWTSGGATRKGFSVVNASGLVASGNKSSEVLPNLFRNNAAGRNAYVDGMAKPSDY